MKLLINIRICWLIVRVALPNVLKMFAMINMLEIESSLVIL